MSTYEIGDENRAWLKFPDAELREWLHEVFGVDATGWARDRMVAQMRECFRKNSELLARKEREIDEYFAREEAKG